MILFANMMSLIMIKLKLRGTTSWDAVWQRASVWSTGQLVGLGPEDQIGVGWARRLEDSRGVIQFRVEKVITEDFCICIADGEYEHMSQGTKRWCSSATPAISEVGVGMEGVVILYNILASQNFARATSECLGVSPRLAPDLGSIVAMYSAPKHVADVHSVVRCKGRRSTEHVPQGESEVAINLTMTINPLGSAKLLDPWALRTDSAVQYAAGHV
ncbi:hypothetical protein BD309DRAFT_1065058 [Dichomitus squalens]|nr:hypothetical protein BD309DRAFT_1065058 [Dichomitus squalens]